MQEPGKTIILASSGEWSTSVLGSGRGASIIRYQLSSGIRKLSEKVSAVSVTLYRNRGKGELQ